MTEIDLPPKTCCLIGAPGSGKTQMIALTAPQPVYFLDTDRKIGSMMQIRDAMAIGKVDIRWDDLAETFTEGSLSSRAIEMAGNKKPGNKPLGWIKFAEMIDGWRRNDKIKDCKTIAIDSITRLGVHLAKLILYGDEAANAAFSPREWGVFLMMWQETIVRLCDEAKAMNKHLIVTVHERIAEVPQAGMKVKRVRDAKGNVSKDYTGNFDMKIAASISGQFGTELPSYFEEVYGLDVVMDNTTGKPKWRCRVKPDGRRDLRTSCVVNFEECEPDFNLIWRFRK